MLKPVFFAAVILGLVLCPIVRSQQAAGNETSVARLIHTHKWHTSEVASLEIDLFLNELGRAPGSSAVFFVYCGQTCRYGEVEAHMRGIRNKLYFRGLKREQYKILHGGYRAKTETEFWLVPENACLPIPKSAVEIDKVVFRGRVKGDLIPYECC